MWRLGRQFSYVIVAAQLKTEARATLGALDD